MIFLELVGGAKMAIRADSVIWVEDAKCLDAIDPEHMRFPDADREKCKSVVRCEGEDGYLLVADKEKDEIVLQIEGD